MSVRINLEIGHEASIRTKRTPEGFTHDWELFVRGCDGADIQHYIEKVVFYLHETFPKPKRVIKEPPYSVKESGYAGFNMPIDIYLRNRDEPKKICFNYDLHLQNTGPPIVKVQNEKYVFNAPGDDFKYKLLKGGGMIVSSSVLENTDIRTVANEEKSHMTSKPKLSGIDVQKKHKIKMEEPRPVDSFHELFGPPITKTTKISPNPKISSKDVNKNTAIKTEKVGDKEKSKSKHSPHKDKDKEKTKEKGESERKSKDEKKKDKERTKEREQSKEKGSKHDKSPRPHSSSPKRSPKRMSSPKRPPTPPKHKDEKKVESSSRDKEKHAEEKSEKKLKKEKRDKEKEHKENRHKERESQKSNELKDKKELKLNKISKEKESSSSPKIEKKEKQKEKEVVKETTKETKETTELDKVERIRGEKSEEKSKHKHKKKDKEKKERKVDREKQSRSEKKSDKTNPVVSKSFENREGQRDSEKGNLFGSPNLDQPTEEKLKEKPIKPLNALFSSEFSQDSSNSPVSSREQSPEDVVPPLKTEIKKEVTADAKKKPEPEKTKVKKEKSKKSKDRKSEKDEKKRKRKSETTNEEEPPEKSLKDECNSNSNHSVEQNVNLTPPREVNKENQENPEDYMQVLRELQHKIMSLQDNSELQKVVQLIAETGRFEVSARTFDFDLCLLERSTVRQLQEFFSSNSS